MIVQFRSTKTKKCLKKCIYK